MFKIIFKKFSTYAQYILPQHLLSFLMGQLAEIRLPWLKNYFIRRFIKKYHLNLEEALDPNFKNYPCFNDFFIRRLKPTARPLAQDEHAIVSPVDGTIAEMGTIRQNQLTQAKHLYFTLDTLLANDKDSMSLFTNGNYATFYLAPHDYHRVHMPLSGHLIKTIYVPGRLFSVNRMTSEIIPNLYGRNERLITLYQTAIGPTAVILVGAMIVGNIQTVWAKHPIRTHQIHTTHHPQDIFLEKGMELGHFKLGSTVILLFPQNTMTWSPRLQPGSAIHFGQLVGNFSR
ncbi:MAG: phosphatidylserine decarboxylase [Gammaproteobacteria bacterium]|nr:phosphatidylserine decarboxylase [Gammaproteobacteria bacterium]